MDDVAASCVGHLDGCRFAAVGVAPSGVGYKPLCPHTEHLGSSEMWSEPLVYPTGY